MEGVELPEPADTDFGIDPVGEIVARPGDTDFDINAGGEIVARPGDTDFGIDPARENIANTLDTDFGIGSAARIPPQPSPLGAGYLILVVREQPRANDPNAPACGRRHWVRAR